MGRKRTLKFHTRPVPPLGEMPPDIKADPDAVAEWERLAALPPGHLQAVDHSLAVAYVLMLVSLRRDITQAAVETSVMATANHYRQPNPIVGVIKMKTMTITKLARELGITPATRDRITRMPPEHTPGQPVDAFTAFQQQRKRPRRP